MASFEKVAAAAASTGAVAAEASGGVQTFAADMQELRTHINECNARVAEATAEHVGNMGALATSVQTLYGAVAEAIQKLSLKVTSMESSGAEREETVYWL